MLAKFQWSYIALVIVKPYGLLLEAHTGVVLSTIHVPWETEGGPGCVQVHKLMSYKNHGTLVCSFDRLMFMYVQVCSYTNTCI